MDTLPDRRKSTAVQQVDKVDLEPPPLAVTTIPATLDADNIGEGFDEESYYKWVRSEFNIPVCHYFIPSPKDKNLCKCGRSSMQHGEITAVYPETTTWSPDKHCRLEPTNCFGTINFVNEDSITMPKFIRVGTTSTQVDPKYTIPEKNIEAIKNLMLDHWKLSTPGLLISVTGGAKSFRLNKTMAGDFQQGLMAAAKATGAWIITGGENCGVMSLVGEAVSLSSFNSSIVAIGIANWGKILNRNMLHTDYAAEDLVIDYRTGQGIKGESSLDPHHTHLFLVDDGYPHTAGCEIKYRIEIQDIIQDMFVHEGMGLPKVCILLEGGEASIDCALNAVQYNNPLLIVKGTGRAADIVCYALEHAESYEKIAGSDIKILWKLGEEATKALKMLIEKHFHKYGFKVCGRIFTKVLKIIESYKMCKIYNTQDESGLDYAILLALISSITESGAATRQMQLAIAWRQPRVAKQFILSKHTFRADQLNHFLDIAIDHQSTEFIRLLLYQGADLKDYLTIGELTHLYNSLPETSCVAKLLYSRTEENVQVSLPQVGMMIEVILEGTYKSPLRDLGDQNHDINDTFANPYDLMMTYATLRGNFDMAMLFWEFTKAPTMCALLGFKICHWLIKQERKNIQTDDDHVQEMTEAANRFEEYAIGVMDECSSEYSRTHLTMFLSVPRKEFSNLNVVDMAYTLEARKFVAHPAYQAHLTDLWLGPIDHTTSTLALIVGCTGACMFMKIFNKKRMTNEEIRQREISREKSKALTDQISFMASKSIPRVSFSHGKSSRSQSKRKKNKSETLMRNLTTCERLKGFFNAPVIKFMLTAVMTTIFVVLFSYSILFIDYDWSLDTILRECGHHIGKSVDRLDYYNCVKELGGEGVSHILSYTDIIILLWICSTIPTELNQIWGETPITICSKVKKYYGSMYNVLDTIAIVFFWFYFIAKAITAEWDFDPFNPFTMFNIGRVCGILSLAIYISRFLQLFEISPKMGPKINMIGKMATDLIFFIFILAIFLVMYMVASEALINPIRSEWDNWRETLLGAFQRSFFNVFGEINVDDLNSDFKSHHCIQLARYQYTKFNESNFTDTGFYSFSAYMMNKSGFSDVSDCTSQDLTTIMSNQDGVAYYTEVTYFMVYAMLCVYLLISNVMLINLLIAIFSSTYERVEQESDVIFRYGRCSVIQEYCDRWILPSPFNLIEVSLTGLSLLRNQILIMKKIKVKKDESADPEVEYKVGLIEAECRALFKKRQETEFTPETLLMNQLRKKTEKVDQKVNQIQESIKGVLAELHIANKNKITPVTELWKRIFSHKYSRESPYPGTAVTKFPVPDNKISWTVKFEAYRPPRLDSPRLNLFDEPADPYLVSYFNDNKEGVNRQSDVAEYAIVDGQPLNPKGRTGLTGRGELERWGPNHITLSLISRWAKRDNKLIVINNLRVLEVIAIRKTGYDLWDLPNGYIDVGETISGGHKRNFMESVLGYNETTGVEKLKMMQMTDRMMQSGIILYKGYFDDARNTDNAWIEVHAVNYHQEDPPYPEDFVAGDFIDEVMWKTLDDKTTMNRNNLWILKKMCIHMGAYNPYKGEVLI